MYVYEPEKERVVMRVNIKEMLEQRERDTLSPFAVLSSESRGRERPVSSDDMRTEFQRDRDRILHCKSFRRLKGTYRGYRRGK